MGGWKAIAAHLCAALLFGRPSVGLEIVPVGEEFQVSTTAEGKQYNPKVTVLSNGGFVVVWESEREERGCSASSQRCSSDADCPGRQYCVPFRHILARIFDPDANPAGEEFRVDEIDFNRPSDPAVAALPDGAFVVTWQDNESIYARTFASSGVARSDARPINQPTFSAFTPSVASSPGGDFGIVWQDRSLPALIHAKRFRTDFGVVQSEFVVGEPLGHFFEFGVPAIAFLPHGNFMVAWINDTSNVVPGAVFGRIFAVDGHAVGETFFIDTGPNLDRARRTDSCAGVSEFVVAWEAEYYPAISDPGVDDICKVRVRRYDDSGSPSGDPFAAGDDSSFASERFGAIACSGDGGFVVSWDSVGSRSSGPILRFFAVDGSSTLPTEIGKDQGLLSDVVHLRDNRFVVAWESNDAEIHGHRFSIEGGTCAGDCNGDGFVLIDELITGVNIALGQSPLASCPTSDGDGDDQISVAELIAAVRRALGGCGD